jgi:hypothetical protein
VRRLPHCAIFSQYNPQIAPDFGIQAGMARCAVHEPGILPAEVSVPITGATKDNRLDFPRRNAIVVSVGRGGRFRKFGSEDL